MLSRYFKKTISSAHLLIYIGTGIRVKDRTKLKYSYGDSCMDIKTFKKILDEFYDDIKSIADEAVGGFAIDSMHPPIEKKKKKKKETLEEEDKIQRVMIDLDKTIHPYKKGWNDGKLEDPPYEGAKKSIDKLKDMGYEIVIYTTRASLGNAQHYNYDVEDEIQNVKNYLTNHGIYFDKITGDKIAADFYIDDKAVYIKNGNWNDVMTQIKKREKSL